MSYKTTGLADQDIINIYVHGVDQAERYHAGIVSVFELLAQNPHLTRERPEFNPPVRLYPYQAHMIAYTIRDDGILIIRVLHGRQDWEQYLG